MEVATGLLLPTSEAQMMLSDGQILDIPAGYCLHPSTGKLLPIAGSLAYNTVACRLVFVLDCTPGMTVFLLF